MEHSMCVTVSCISSSLVRMVQKLFHDLRWEGDPMLDGVLKMDFLQFPCYAVSHVNELLLYVTQLCSCNKVITRTRTPSDRADVS